MPERAIDAIDRKILAELQRDGRITVQDLAERVGLSPSPTLRRIRMLEEAGILKGYVALVDQARVGLPISVFASVKLERQREEELDRFAEAVARWPEVVECYLMTGRHDYLVRVGPYTFFYTLQSPVFLVNSCYSLFNVTFKKGPLYPEVTELICRVP